MCVCVVWWKVPAGKKKGQKSAASKKKSTKSKSSAQRKTSVKLGQPYAGNDLTAKLFATMEKHKDVSNGLFVKPRVSDSENTKPGFFGAGF